MRRDARVIGLAFGQFQRLTSDMEGFHDLIAYLCANGDVAYLVDATGRVGEVIVLNFDQIDIFREVINETLEDKQFALRSEAIEELRRSVRHRIQK